MATATAAAGPEQVEALDQVLLPTEIDSRAFDHVFHSFKPPGAMWIVDWLARAADEGNGNGNGNGGGGTGTSGGTGPPPPNGD